MHSDKNYIALRRVIHARIGGNLDSLYRPPLKRGPDCEHLRKRGVSRCKIRQVAGQRSRGMVLREVDLPQQLFRRAKPEDNCGKQYSFVHRITPGGSGMISTSNPAAFNSSMLSSNAPPIIT